MNLSDPAVVADAVIHNPSCAGCHQAMDPLASYFFPFLQWTMNSVYIPTYPVDFYQPDAASAWMTTTGRPPGYFGTQPAGLAGLGKAIAADPRFARCAAVNFASYLTEKPARDLPPAWIAELQDGFVQSGYSAKLLARAIVMSDEFRLASAADPVAAEGVIGYQKLRPAQLSRMLLRYDNFGAPFIVNWCRACHSADTPPGMRQQAPADINFDNLSEIRHWSLQIRITAGQGGSMPPAGGPSAEERRLLVEWLGCGAP